MGSEIFERELGPFEEVQALSRSQNWATCARQGLIDGTDPDPDDARGGLESF